MISLYLIGFRGSGKTTFGSLLAQRKKMAFVDLDERFEKRTGKKILEFVETQGLPAFRAEEEAVLREIDQALQLPEAPATVVATGGGVVEWPASCQILAHSPFPKIYLELAAKELWERLKDSPERRKIGELNGFEALESLLEKRREAYEKIATFRLWNQDISVALDALEQQWGDLGLARGK